MAEPPSDWRPYLGRKVSLRYRLHGDPQHPFSEAIGVIAEVGAEGGDAQVVTLYDRRGTRVSVRAGDVLAAKVFPA